MMPSFGGMLLAMPHSQSPKAWSLTSNSESTGGLITEVLFCVAGRIMACLAKPRPESLIQITWPAACRCRFHVLRSRFAMGWK
jgi:hypothetical protein